MPTGAAKAAKRGLPGRRATLREARTAGARRLHLERTRNFAAALARIGAAPVPHVQSQPLAGPTVGETFGTGRCGSA